MKFLFLLLLLLPISVLSQEFKAKRGIVYVTRPDGLLLKTTPINTETVINIEENRNRITVNGKRYTIVKINTGAPDVKGYILGNNGTDKIITASITPASFTLQIKGPNLTEAFIYQVPTQ
jgi:hypothetical protein